MDTMHLPQGTVAFLFTDVEGSSTLWERFPEAMEEAYRRHDLILREATAAQSGIVYKIVGDAFQIAFPSPAGAIIAAVHAQLALLDEPWPLPNPLRVRMALHLALAAPDRHGDYRTPQLNRLGRLISLAHGGQILGSQTIADALGDSLPDCIALRMLGTVRLRGIDLPEPIVQIVAERLLDQFPPLQAPDLIPNNLPQSPTPLIGRKAEMERLTGLLLDGPSRIVTLAGSGGIGKTRLALEMARGMLDVGHGAFFVDLSGMRDPMLVMPAIAGALGVRASGGESSDAALRALLKHESWLLVLDNLEQVIDAAPAIADLSADCPALRLLVTSREPLRLRGERVMRVEPLAVPDPISVNDLAAMRQIDSVALFVERASAVRSDFSLDNGYGADVAAICIALDGVPLAIELAASKVRALSPRSIRNWLAGGLSQLAGGARDLPSRHQSLRGTIAWSYDLMGQSEQRALQALSLFAGGFTLDAADAMFTEIPIDGDAAEIVLSLVDKSLLQQRDGAMASDRFGMFESVREYAIERLGETPADATVRRIFADWCLSWGEDAAAQPPETGFQRIDEERDNLLEALRWANAARQTSISLGLSTIMARYWRVRGHVAEGRRFLETALVVSGNERTKERLDGLVEAGSLAFVNGDYDASLRWSEAGLVLSRELDDPPAMAALLNTVAGVRLNLGEIDAAEQLYAECADIARRTGDRRRLAGTLGNLGAVAHYRGNSDSAAQSYREALEMHRELNDSFGVAMMLGNMLALLAPFPEHHNEALDYGDESLHLSCKLGDRQGEAYTLGVIGYIADLRGESRRAIDCHQQCLEIFEEIDDRSGIARALDNLGQAHLSAGHLETALRLCHDSLDRYVELDERDSIAHCFEGLGAIACTTSDYDQSIALLAAAEALREMVGVPVPIETRSRYDRTISTLQASFDADEFAERWKLGRSLTIEDARAVARTLKAPWQAGARFDKIAPPRQQKEHVNE